MISIIDDQHLVPVVADILFTQIIHLLVNNDGSNDVFRAKSYSKVLSFRLEIYNRNGELVFRTTDVNKGWNGMYKGIAVPAAVFVYQCSYQLEGMPAAYKKGTLLLAR